MGAFQADEKVKKILIISTKGPFLICIVMCNEKWILYTQQLAMTSSVVGTEKLETLTKAKLAPKNGHVTGALVSLDPLQLSESW